MNKQKWIILASLLVLVGGTAGFLGRLEKIQKLGVPGVKTRPVGDGKEVEVALPEQVLDCTSERVEVQKLARDMLPKDTCFGQRLYQAPDGFVVQATVVLMGSDRTSIHRPQFCLRGSGRIIQKEERETIPMTRPNDYLLPVTKLTLVPEPGAASDVGGGIYVYWFVADNEYTASPAQRMWWMFRDLATTGTLQRWAYITFFAPCLPGQEDATFERLKKMIAAAAPDFQLTPRALGIIAEAGK
ncbi:MAG TPA: exosortase-associated EpsI family protein [Candidatus Binatia bacterium]|nr:exosortase-associated EpsI family protein [Candidatus Binatia bacterium]